MNAHKLTAGDLVTLYELDAREIGGDVMRFHNHTAERITFQGLHYDPWSISTDGFERTGNAQQPMPKIMVGNIGKDASGKPIVGVISALCAALQDLVGATMIRRRTFAQFLDGEPQADPAREFPPEIWIIEQKESESAEAVVFRLSSPMDFDNMQLPARQVVANVCPWTWIGGYRGPYCGYTGNRYFDRNGKQVGSIAQDVCSGLRAHCELRFGKNQQLNFGGFPSADRTR